MAAATRDVLVYQASAPRRHMCTAQPHAQPTRAWMPTGAVAIIRRSIDDVTHACLPAATPASPHSPPRACKAIESGWAGGRPASGACDPVRPDLPMSASRMCPAGGHAARCRIATPFLAHSRPTPCRCRCVAARYLACFPANRMMHHRRVLPRDPSQAKLAEEAERYEDMVANVKALAELNIQLNVEVRQSALTAPAAARGRTGSRHFALRRHDLAGAQSSVGRLQERGGRTPRFLARPILHRVQGEGEG